MMHSDRNPIIWIRHFLAVFMIASAPLTALAEANITPESPARIGRVDIAQMPADGLFNMVAQTCSACHSKFRVEKK